MPGALHDFLNSLTAAAPPPGETVLLTAVWHALKGSWVQAHKIVEQRPDAKAAVIHAWLHRIEGDSVNAGYWYRRADREPSTGSTQDEGRAIAAELLARRTGARPVD